MSVKPRLLVTDIDNTLFDWVSYYTSSLESMLGFVSKKLGLPYSLLLEEARAVFSSEDSIEYPFVVQSMPSVIKFFGADIDRLLEEVVRPSREIFKATASAFLKPYPGVVETLDAFESLCPDVPLVALTDAPRYVAMWKLNKLGLLHRFSAIYGRSDPRLPVDMESAKIRYRRTFSSSIFAQIILDSQERSEFCLKSTKSQVRMVLRWFLSITTAKMK